MQDTVTGRSRLMYRYVFKIQSASVEPNKDLVHLTWNTPCSLKEVVMSQFSDWNELLVRDFGVLLDSELFMADNGKSRCTPCYYVLRQIRFIQRSLFFSLVSPRHSFILKRFDYCNCVLSSEFVGFSPSLTAPFD